MKLRLKLWLEEDGKPVFGDGRMRLLKAIDETGSLRAATERMGISYRHAWGELKKIEERLGFRLIEPHAGGRGGGGSRLTEHAREFLKGFDKARVDINRYVEKKYGSVDF